MAVGRAWREAAHHSLHRGQATAAGLLHHADQAVHQGGHGAAAGIADDLDEWLATKPDTSGTVEAALTLQCLRAEAAVRVGDAAVITALTSGVTTATATADTMVGARLAMAAVHGQRIAGHTKAALPPGVWPPQVRELILTPFLAAEITRVVVDRFRPCRHGGLPRIEGIHHHMARTQNARMFEAPEPPYRPCLKHAYPDGATGRYHKAGPHGTLREVPFTDGVWRSVTVLGSEPDRGGGWRVLIRWFDGGSTREDWLTYDASKFRGPPRSEE